jgi:ribosome-binding protein aMBF1 (putative translation factor)
MVAAAVTLFKRIAMSILFKSETEQILLDAPPSAERSSAPFDLDIAVRIGKHIEARRVLCGLSEQQLAARLGIHAADVNAYERGARRITCKLLLEAVKQLNATPRFFFQ